MRKLTLGLVVAIMVCVLPSMQAADNAKADSDAAQIIVELGDAMTFGEFNYEDTTIEVNEEFVNPRGSIEFRFAGSPISIGGEYAQSKNEFDGEYEDSDGTLEMERKEFVAFVRFGHKNGCNLRLGYRNFQYDINNAWINQRENGVLTEIDMDGIAEGKLSTGADVELNLAAGTSVQFALGLGYTFFKDAEYEWSYTAIGDNAGFHAGAAEVDAHSVRVRPEISFGLSDELRVFVNGTIAATAWDIDKDDDDTPDYPGIDIYSAIGAGIRYTFGL